MSMARLTHKPVPFSTTLSPQTKALLERFCEQRGIRQNHLVEEAILERLEDEMDMQTIREREFEELVGPVINIRCSSLPFSDPRCIESLLDCKSLEQDRDSEQRRQSTGQTVVVACPVS